MEVSAIQSNIYHLPFKVSDADKEEKWWHKILEYFLPTPKQVNICITKVIIGIFIYAISYGMLGDKALPGGEIFALLLMVLCAIIGGKLIGLLNLPPLLGMLLVGFTFRNVHAFPFYSHISKKTIVTLREIALSIILMRAGIGLNGESLKKLKLVVLRLTVLPCITEAVTMGIFGHYLLKLPFIFSFMLGFIISAISPEVVLPPVLQLERERYGVKKGIPALIIGATSLDDILAIAGFTVCFSVAFSTKDLVWTIVKAPLEPILGFAFAVLFGVIFWYFPSTKTPKPILIYYNVIMVFFGAMAAMFLSHKLDVTGAGPLTCIILAFVACLKWRKDPVQFKGIYTATLILWTIVEPILFSLIGAEITIEILKDNAGYGILALLTSLAFRTMMTAAVIFGANLNIKEKIFICCSYMPKASVQAAIGSQALDYARANKMGEEQLHYGLTVLNVCVMSLILTAPVAAILINLLGRVLLTKDDPSMHPEEHSESSEEVEKALTDGKRVVSDYSTVNLIRAQDMEERNKIQE